MSKCKTLNKTQKWNDFIQKPKLLVLHIFLCIALHSIPRNKKRKKKRKSKKPKKKHNPYVVLFTCKKNKKNIFEFTALFILPTIQRRRGYQSQRTSNYISTTKINEEEDDDNNYENIFTTLRNKPNTLPFQKHFPPTIFFIIFFLLFNVNIFLFSTTYALTYFYDYDNCTHSTPLFKFRRATRKQLQRRPKPQPLTTKSNHLYFAFI